MTSPITISINKDYGYVLGAAGAISAQCFLTGFSINFLRKKIFTKEFMQEHFSKIHMDELGQKIGALGLPDTGSGRYSEKLSYKDWYQFNLAQRTHQNFVEQIGLVLPTLLASGVFHPRLAAALGWAYFFGRLIYTLHYRKAGPKGRLFGAYTFFGTILGLAGLTIWAGIKLLRARKSN